MNDVLTTLPTVFRDFWKGWFAGRHDPSALVAEVQRASHDLRDLDDAELTGRFRVQWACIARDGLLQEGEQKQEVVAITLEAARRVLNIELYPSQILAGMNLLRNVVVEMATGEGKTYAILIPTVVHALLGRGVHVMTTNAYLARRDFELLSPVYRYLGLTAGLLTPEADLNQKRAAYARDITYGPGYEFGFDYLRDQLALMQRATPRLGQTIRNRYPATPLSIAPAIQRGHACAIIDEADSVLLDEATMPMILAGEAESAAEDLSAFPLAHRFIRSLKRDHHFTVHEQGSTLLLTDAGRDAVRAEATKIASTVRLQRPWVHYVEQALKAQWLLKRDQQYIVQQGQLHLVDQTTGRIFNDRTLSMGLHQAVQAKEGIRITGETRTMARISRQRFLSLYSHRCGLTGTIQGHEDEIKQVYRVDTVPIPLHRPSQRITFTMRAFATRDAKEAAIAADVAARARLGQPVLIGTATIDASQRLANQFDALGIRYQLLNGKQDADEATIVAGAGRRGAITIATNMAGRGTDIKLAPETKALGGLHVIVAEPQESARADRQLVGRAARQGDPGSCQTFLSAEDALVHRHAPQLAAKILKDCNGATECATDFTDAVRKLQRHLQHQSTLQRQQMFSQDRWLEETLRELHGPAKR